MEVAADGDPPARAAPRARGAACGRLVALARALASLACLPVGVLVLVAQLALAPCGRGAVVCARDGPRAGCRALRAWGATADARRLAGLLTALGAAGAVALVYARRAARGGRRG